MPATQDHFMGVWKVPANFRYLEGHFPGLPIVPGFAIIEYSADWLKEQLGDPQLILKEIRSAKFKQPITPGMNVQLTTNFSSNEWRFELTELESKAELANLSLIFQPRGP